MADGHEQIAEALRHQAASCAWLGSPLYAMLLGRAAEDVLGAGPVWHALTGHEADPVESVLGLRLMGAIHRLVLEGRAPDLAVFYPSAGGTVGEPDDAWRAFVSTVDEHRDEVRRLVHRTVQTNEVGRAGALVGGFLTVANRTGLPLRILEVGASAGFLLRWDRYLYEQRGATWGPEDSPVRLCDYNTEVRLPFDVDATVIERGGCDPNPLDPTTDEGRTTLSSYVWPDQLARLRNLRAAIQVAASEPVQLERVGAAEWLERKLAETVDGVATVVFHSIVLQYLSDDERERVGETISEAGRSAGAGGPVSWLRMEPGGDVAHVHLTMWPEGTEEERLIATSGYHGTAVRWLGFD